MKIAFAPQGKSERDQQKLKDFLALPNNRKKRRRLPPAPVVPGMRGTPGKRACNLKAVKRPEQLAIEFRRAQRVELLRIKLHRLLPECAEIRFILGSTRIRNVWALSQAPTAVIAAIPQFGSARAGKLHKYLTGKGIPVVWDPNTRVVR